MNLCSDSKGMTEAGVVVSGALGGEASLSPAGFVVWG